MWWDILFTLGSYAFLGGIIGYVTNFIAIKRIFMASDLKIGRFVLLRKGIIHENMDDMLQSLAKIIDQVLSDNNIQTYVLTRENKQEIVRQISVYLKQQHPILYKLAARDILVSLLEALPGFMQQLRDSINVVDISQQYLSKLDINNLEQLVNENSNNALRHLCWAGLYIGLMVGALQAGTIVLLTLFI